MGRRAFLGVLLILLAACGTPSAAQPTSAPAAPEPTIAPAVAAPEPTREAHTTQVPLPTIAPDAPTDEPIDTPAATLETTPAPPENTPEAAPASRATFTPAPTGAELGAVPQGSDCPADHPVKGNIVDRGANKGEKIYHLPGDNGYAQTKPERCFVDAAEAEAAGFRPVKKK